MVWTPDSLFDIWGSHGGEDDVGLLRCDTVWTRSYIQTFRGNILSPSSPALKMETVWFSETLVSTYEFTCRHNPEDQYCHILYCLVSNFISFIFLVLSVSFLLTVGLMLLMPIFTSVCYLRRSVKWSVSLSLLKLGKGSIFTKCVFKALASESSSFCRNIKSWHYRNKFTFENWYM
jgi:hypothetical protein